MLFSSVDKSYKPAAPPRKIAIVAVMAPAIMPKMTRIR